MKFLEGSIASFVTHELNTRKWLVYTVSSNIKEPEIQINEIAQKYTI